MNSMNSLAPKRIVYTPRIAVFYSIGPLPSITRSHSKAVCVESQSFPIFTSNGRRTSRGCTRNVQFGSRNVRIRSIRVFEVKMEHHIGGIQDILPPNHREKKIPASCDDCDEHKRDQCDLDKASHSCPIRHFVVVESAIPAKNILRIARMALSTFCHVL